MLNTQRCMRSLLNVASRNKRYSFVTYVIYAPTLRFAHAHVHGPDCNHSHNHDDQTHVRNKTETPDAMKLKLSEDRLNEVSVSTIALENFTQEEIKTAIQECVNTLELKNREQYIIAARMKNIDAREVYAVLHVLNGELANIKVRTTNPQTAALRMTWWKTYIAAALNGTPPDVPVLIALSYYAKKYDIKMSQLRNMLKMRELDLRWKQPPDLEAIENYAESIFSTILYVTLHAMGVKDAYVHHIASHVGKSFGLTLLLRGTIHHTFVNMTYLPASLCAKYGVTEDQIYAKEYTKEIGDVVFEIADTAKAHLDVARKYASEADPKTLTPDIKKVFQCAIYADTVLYRLEKVNFNVFDNTISNPDLIHTSLVFNILKSSLFGGFLGSLTEDKHKK